MSSIAISPACRSSSVSMVTVHHISNMVTNSLPSERRFRLALRARRLYIFRFNLTLTVLTVSFLSWKALSAVMLHRASRQANHASFRPCSSYGGSLVRSSRDGIWCLVGRVYPLTIPVGFGPLVGVLRYTVPPCRGVASATREWEPLKGFLKRHAVPTPSVNLHKVPRRGRNTAHPAWRSTRGSFRGIAWRPCPAPLAPSVRSAVPDTFRQSLPRWTPPFGLNVLTVRPGYTFWLLCMSRRRVDVVTGTQKGRAVSSYHPPRLRRAQDKRKAPGGRTPRAQGC